MKPLAQRHAWVLSLAALGLALGVSRLWALEADESKPAAGPTSRPEGPPTDAPDKPRDQSEPEVVIRGKVVDAETGRPITRFVEQGGMPDPADPSRILWGFTERRGGENPSGTFDATLGGRHRFRVRILASGYVPQPVPFDPAKPGGGEVIVKMKRGRELAGRVVDHRGKPVAGAAVFLVGMLPANITGGKALRSFGGEEPAITRTMTDADGRFILQGAGGDKAQIAVSAPALDLWVVPAPEEGREALVQLPAPGRLIVRFDILGDEAEAELALQLTSPKWERVESYRKPRVANGSRVILDNVTPGAYDLTRYRQVRLGAGETYGLFCDRRTPTVRPGETVEIDYVRERGAPVTGRVIGPEGAEIDGALITVVPADEGASGGAPFVRTIFDARGIDPDGRFRTARLEPGAYAVVAEANRPPAQRGNGGRTTGLGLPDFVGVARVTVGERGPTPALTIELKPSPAPGEAAARPRKDPGAEWGEPVDGVQCRLRADRTRWTADETPALRADIRNSGTLVLIVAQAQQLCELEVDGRWYRWAGDIDVKSSAFDPGRRYDGIAITLGKDWTAKEGGDPLMLTPGRHRIRIAFFPEAHVVAGIERLRVVSRRVEIEVTAKKGPWPEE